MSFLGKKDILPEYQARNKAIKKRQTSIEYEEGLSMIFYFSSVEKVNS